MKIVKEFLDKKFGNTIPVLHYFDDIKSLLLEFGNKVCELQKQECLNNANILRLQYHFDEDMNPTDNVTETIDTQFSNTDYDFGYNQLYKINEDSILNCKNVCNI